MQQQWSGEHQIICIAHVKKFQSIYKIASRHGQLSRIGQVNAQVIFGIYGMVSRNPCYETDFDGDIHISCIDIMRGLLLICVSQREFCMRNTKYACYIYAQLVMDELMSKSPRQG